MFTKLPRETHAPNGDRIQALIPGEILQVTLNAGDTWDTTNVSFFASVVQFDVQGDGLVMIDYSQAVNGYDPIEDLPGFPLRSGGVYTFGIPQTDPLNENAVVDQGAIMVQNRGAEPVVLSVIAAGA